MGLVIVVALLAGGVGWWFGSGPGAQASVPDVTGQDPAAATAALTSAGFVVAPDPLSDFSPVIPTGQVARTDPDASTRVQKGTTITLVVSQGPRQLTVPTVVGETESAATDSLSDFSVQPSTSQFDEAAAGTVLAISGVDGSGGAIDLAGAAQYGEQQPVTLTVSLGPVPDVAGLSVADAQTALAGAQLSGVESATEFSDDIASGQVIRYEQQAEGPLHQGDTVNLIVSKGPPPITIPDVRGKTIDAATSQLQGLGFRVSYPRCTAFTCAFYDWEASLPVTATDPEAGLTATKGATITLSYRVE